MIRSINSTDEGKQIVGADENLCSSYTDIENTACYFGEIGVSYTVRLTGPQYLRVIADGSSRQKQVQIIFRTPHIRAFTKLARVSVD